jgi:hypothetical protein
VINELFRKWFGLEPSACPVCEVLREQLTGSERERKELLQRALTPPSIPVEPVDKEEIQPIKPQFIPWRIRQQMLEAEDRKKAQLMKDRVADLEKDLGVENHG